MFKGMKIENNDSCLDNQNQTSGSIVLYNYKDCLDIHKINTYLNIIYVHCTMKLMYFLLLSVPYPFVNWEQKLPFKLKTKKSVNNTFRSVELNRSVIRRRYIYCILYLATQWIFLVMSVKALAIKKLCLKQLYC